MRTCRTQQLGCQRGRSTELAGQVQHSGALRHGKTHDQAKLAGNVSRSRLTQDLRQLLRAVEHEVAHGVTRPGLADGAARLDRVHEMDRRVRKHLAHQGDLAD